MSGWKIEPAGVQTALSNTQDAATTLSKAFDALMAAQESLTTACGDDQAVPGAVAELITSHKDLLTRVGNHITAGLAGASAATLAYYNGDEQMATSLQADAVRASGDGDFSSFHLGDS